MSDIDLVYNVGLGDMPGDGRIENPRKVYNNVNVTPSLAGWKSDDQQLHAIMTVEAPLLVEQRILEMVVAYCGSHSQNSEAVRRLVSGIGDFGTY